MCGRFHLSIGFRRLVQQPLAEQVQASMLRTFAVQVELNESREENERLSSKIDSLQTQLEAALADASKVSMSPEF